MNNLELMLLNTYNIYREDLNFFRLCDFYSENDIIYYFTMILYDWCDYTNINEFYKELNHCFGTKYDTKANKIIL